ncbi:MAG: hypothetical protein ACJA2Q_002854 [Pseudohongiellaceae bacterium]|jgi:hypothetical protein
MKNLLLTQVLSIASRKTLITASVSLIMSASASGQVEQPMEPQPALVQSSMTGDAPSDAIVLFSGNDLLAWERTADDEPARWMIENQVMTVQRDAGTIKTKQLFGDMQLHLEWRPSATIEGSGQSRGNSGVFLHSLFELQILDSWDNPTYINGQAGSIYLQYAPLVNASKPPGEWQSFDITFSAPRYYNGQLETPAFVTVFQNGLLIQNHVEILGTTYTTEPEYKTQCEPYSQNGRLQDCSGKMPITLQDHGQIVSYRNIWVREL